MFTGSRTVQSYWYGFNTIYEYDRRSKLSILDCFKITNVTDNIEAFNLCLKWTSSMENELRNFKKDD